MFVIGFALGIAAAGAYVLYGDHDRLIELAEKARAFAAKVHAHDWGRTQR